MKTVNVLDSIDIYVYITRVKLYSIDIYVYITRVKLDSIDVYVYITRVKFTDSMINGCAVAL